MRRIAIAVLFLAAITLASCDNSYADNNQDNASSDTIYAPEYAEIVLLRTYSTRSFHVDSDGLMAILPYAAYHWYSPIVTGFEEKNSDDVLGRITVLGCPVTITHTEEDGNSVFIGQTSDDTFYSKVVYDSKSDTFSYLQYLISDFEDGRNRIDIVRGDSIGINQNSTLQGVVRHYFLQTYTNSTPAELGVDDGEYFSGSAGSGTVVKGTKTFVADNSSSGVVLDSLSGLTPTADNVDKIIRIGDDEYSKYSDEMSTYEKMVWFDGTNPSMFPENSEAIFNADELASEKSKGEWNLSVPSEVVLQ